MTIAKYQTDHPSALVHRTPLEPRIYAGSSTPPWYHPYTRGCRGKWTDQQSFIFFTSFINEMTFLGRAPLPTEVSQVGKLTGRGKIQLATSRSKRHNLIRSAIVAGFSPSCIQFRTDGVRSCKRALNFKDVECISHVSQIRPSTRNHRCNLGHMATTHSAVRRLRSEYLLKYFVLLLRWRNINNDVKMWHPRRKPVAVLKYIFNELL